MVRFIVRRMLGILLALWAAVTLTFFAMHVVPGDPVEAALSQSVASPDVLARRRAALGLDQPVLVQYERYMLNLARGDLGISWQGDQPVAWLIGQQIPATLSLAVAGMALALLVGGALGIGAALGREGMISVISRSMAGFLLSVPVMFSGTLLIWLFAVLLDWLPAVGQGSVAHLILPACVVGLSGAGGIARTVDAGATQALREQFIITARAKGLSYRQTVWRHALRVGLLPTLNVVALQFGFLLSGTVVTETVFARQGIGRLLVSAVLDKNLPVVQGVVVLALLAYSLLNLGADIAHAWLDPRIRYDGS